MLIYICITKDEITNAMVNALLAFARRKLSQLSGLLPEHLGPLGHCPDVHSRCRFGAGIGCCVEQTGWGIVWSLVLWEVWRGTALDGCFGEFVIFDDLAPSEDSRLGSKSSSGRVYTV